MCELLGVSSRNRVSVNDLLREFYSHAGEHPHGWGLARFSADGTPLVEKEPVRALDSAYLASRLRGRLDEKTLIAHIRLATVGMLEYENCHPFVRTDSCGRTWTLAHNGTVFRGPELNAYLGLQRGQTDSERILLHLVARVNERQGALGRALDEAERFETLEAALAPLAEGSKLNLLFFDGEVLYAHTNFRDSLHFRQNGDAVVFSTRPLKTGAWEDVPFTRLLAVKNGSFVREGADHGHEYVYNPEDYRHLYMDFAAL